MPELPEVHTTVEGLKKEVIGYKIADIWTNYKSSYHARKDNIKNPDFYKRFKSELVGSTIIGAYRRAKNVLIKTNVGKTILIHMKMTGHIMVGNYEMSSDKKDARDPWFAVSKNDKDARRDDPYNRKIRFVLTLTKGAAKSKKNIHLVLSDVRRFAKVTMIDTLTAHLTSDLKEIGPEPLENNFTVKDFHKQLLLKPHWKIKPTILDQSLIAGIGNIYSDEMLWMAGIHPESIVKKVPTEKITALYKAMREVLKKGIDFGGDSMSDYRNVYGERGNFQHNHNVYRKTGTICAKPRCGGTILRKKIGGRSSHFCVIHQIKY